MEMGVALGFKNELQGYLGRDDVPEDIKQSIARELESAQRLARI
jgi:hypothetical protein